MSDPDSLSVVTAAADRLNALTVPPARQRIADMGSDNAGAYNFYQVRIDRSDLFADYERRLVARLLADPDAFPVLHDIGGGYGTFAWLAASVGFETVCIELDPRRLDGGVALWGATRAGWPNVPGTVRFVPGRFPSEAVQPQGAWAVVTNLVATTPPAVRATIVAALGRYAVAVIDVDRFFEHAREPGQRAVVLKQLRSSGLSCEPYLDLGTSACFYKVTRTVPSA